MEIHIVRPRSFFLFFTFVLILASGFYGPKAFGQPETFNQFVGAVVDNPGLVTLYQGNPLNGLSNQQLTYRLKSFLTLRINANGTNKIYSNNSTPNPNIPIDVPLTSPLTVKVKDTVRSTWKEQGFDIQQNVYPVAFSQSGVIVISVKIVNHTQTDIPLQAEYLLDNENTTADSANDNPYLVSRYGFLRNWEDCPPNTIPSFYVAFEYPPWEQKLGTVGIQYLNDSFPPSPLGLTPVSLVEFGNWPDQQAQVWGPVGGTSDFSDQSTLTMGEPTLASAFSPGVYDSVTEVFRIAYGTPEWCYDHGKLVGFALYPHHITWDPVALTYTPNPFQVDAFLFPVTPSGAGGISLRQTVADPIRIISPKPTGVPKDTTQLQAVGSIAFGGVTDVHWTDSVFVIPSGCTSTIPVSLDFTIKSNIDTPFVEPWNCAIDVDCAHPDTLPPAYQNSFVGCDSVFYDTITATDNQLFDLGLQNISYSSSDLNASQYQVTINPPPPYSCIATPVKIDVKQLDTVHSGHVIFTFTDCASNISHDTICFTAHPPIPDRTAPKFWLDSGSSCNNLCTKWTVTDSNVSAISIDRGIDKITIDSNTNMTLTGVPNGGQYPAGTQTTTFEVCVTDPLSNGILILRASDTSHNISFDTIHYCTTPDTHGPIIIGSAFDNTTSSWHIHVTDTEAWDRGVDSVWIDPAKSSNVETVPAAIPNPIGCKPTFNFDVKVVDTSECANVTIDALDCAGNLAAPVSISFSKSGIPVIAASKTILCGGDSVLLDAGANYATYKWSNGDTTRTIEVTTAGIYTVTVGEGGSCSATSGPISVTSDPATPQITPVGPIALCAPDNAVLDAGTGFTTYQWQNNGTDIAGATSEKFTATASGSYTAKVTNSNGCSGTSTPVSVTIYPVPPQPVITSSNGVMSSTLASSYQWNQNGVPIPGATGQTFTATNPNPYTVTITDSHGCQNTSAPFAGTGTMTVSVPAMVTANQSNTFTMSLSLSNVQGVPASGNATNYTVVLRFNKTLLIPQFGTFVIQGNDLVVTYSGSGTMTNGILQQLSFLAALGDTTCTSVTIDTFYWNTPNVIVNRVNGTFCLTGLCQQGGTRLIDPTGAFSLSVPKPNPAYSSVEIDYELVEKGETQLIVYDLLGHEVLRLVDAEQTPGVYGVSADVSTLSVGTYIYSLRTPSLVKSNYLKISR